MINKLCNTCVKTCKQSNSAKIASCPKFQKIPSEGEVREMVNELDTVESKAKKLQKSVKEVIDRALSGDSEKPADGEE